MPKVFNESFIEAECYPGKPRGSPQRMIPVHDRPLISTVARSPGLDADAVDIVVSLPTFRRPVQLLETLASLQAQETSRRFAVIVIENEAEKREGAIAATPLFESAALDGLIIVAHQRGNCSAYNAGWETALSVFPAFSRLLVIDDDEIADPHWLERMCAAAERFRADIVGGPQIPVFPENSDQRLAVHPVFAPPYRQSGPVDALYSSGNLLIGRNVLTAMGAPFLDLRFNFMGGGDSDFLNRAAVKGFRLAWCARGARPGDSAGAPAGGRLDPLAQPAQRRHLDPGREEEAGGLAGRQSTRPRQEPRAARRLAASRPRAPGQHRLAVERHLSRLCRDGPRARGIRLRE